MARPYFHVGEWCKSVESSNMVTKSNTLIKQSSRQPARHGRILYINFDQSPLWNMITSRNRFKSKLNPIGRHGDYQTPTCFVRQMWHGAWPRMQSRTWPPHSAISFYFNPYSVVVVVEAIPLSVSNMTPVIVSIMYACYFYGHNYSRILELLRNLK